MDEYSFPVTVDEILIRGVDNYKDYPQRLQIARRIVQSPDASDYVHNYFKNVIEQMGHAEMVAKEISPDMAGAKNGEGRNGTNIAVRILGKNVEGAEGNLSVANDADVPSIHRRFYMVIGGMLLLTLAVLAFVALFSTRRAPLSRKDHG